MPPLCGHEKMKKMKRKGVVSKKNFTPRTHFLRTFVSPCCVTQAHPPVMRYKLSVTFLVIVFLWQVLFLASVVHGQIPGPAGAASAPGQCKSGVCEDKGFKNHDIHDRKRSVHTKFEAHLHDCNQGDTICNNARSQTINFLRDTKPNCMCSTQGCPFPVFDEEVPRKQKKAVKAKQLTLGEIGDLGECFVISN